MAATDKTYRDQYSLDVVFAVSSVLMLVSIIWMFVDDYNREFKTEQRRFRDVEAALAQRQALDLMPTAADYEGAEEAVKEARANRIPEKLKKATEDLTAEVAKNQAALDALQAEVAQVSKGNAKADQIEAAKTKLKEAENQLAAMNANLERLKERVAINAEYPKAKQRIADLLPRKEQSEKDYNAVKAEFDSITSFYDIAVEEHGPGSEKAKEYFGRIQELRKQVADAQAVKDKIAEEVGTLRRVIDAYEGPLTAAISNWKKVTDKFDTQVSLAINKQWGVGDFVRSLPVIDPFAPPLKIHQFTINDIPINYNFKYVTRFDRCVTCHQGIDRPTFTRAKIGELTKDNSDLDYKLADAHEMMKRRRRDLAGLPEAANLPYWKDLQLTKVSKTELTPARIAEFAAHPRLELFVGTNSKHPAEKFGCTSCHSGQGSSTDFQHAAHTPNTSTIQNRWVAEHGWEREHMWDFPMNPMRFVESGCLKCHHQVTDLVGSDNRNEAPKLLRGFNLIKENGCFGCHEIAGRKSGRQIGPDLRLEPTPPLESLTPNERAKIESDIDNPPGTLRKVGPSLFRLSEKTHTEWLVKWLRSPRGFRPDTKMPHFYGLSNNDHTALKGTGQELFPDTEIHAIAHFLVATSNNYLKEVSDSHKETAAGKEKQQARLTELQALTSPNEAQKKELDGLKLRRVQLQGVPLLKDLMPAGYKPDAAHGRQLFSERGCLACHSHQATETVQGKAGDKDFVPAISGEAIFGPNLSQLVDKLGAKKGDKESARIWLTQWVMNPNIHSPRTRMPITHLNNAEATDVAAWLLSQKATDEGPEWADLTVLEPDSKELKKLAAVYLARLQNVSQSDVEAFLKTGKMRPDVAIGLPIEEKELVKDPSDNGYKLYLGKKAVSRMGCYACHDIPGFDNAKPIGVALNDWGIKDPGRLAFEDIDQYLEHHFQVVPSLTDPEGKPRQGKVVKDKDGHTFTKEPYEKFYADALVHRHREGYLNQKIYDPRSYDYNRLRAWDDLSRMPQFRFARSRKLDKESAEEFQARANKEEAEAREAVATFILGLVAEQVPAASINQPKGDRMAEVKGRQILDKFNCGGCHLVRPGAFDFKVTKESLDTLDSTFIRVRKNAQEGGEHFFGFHSDWVGRNPASPDRLAASVARPKLYIDDDDGKKSAEFRLTRALRFLGSDKKLKDIDSARVLRLAPRDMIYPPPEAWQSPETLTAFLKDKGPYGGAFADVLVDYLVAKDKGEQTPFFVRDTDGDSSKARAAVPPILLGQGERTQADWLYRFLLNPEPVRKMTVLRMPKFNMSTDEAKTLVDYFAAVERYENPGIGLKYPYETIPQQEPFTEAFWLQKNVEQIAKLKAAKAKDASGKDISLYEQRVQELTLIWQQIRKDRQAEETKAKAQLDELKPAYEKAKKAYDDEKDPAKKSVLEPAFKKQESAFQSWEAEYKTLAELVKKSSIDDQRQLWETEQAYLSDAFRLLANKQLCMQCHQIGSTPVNNQIQGPPLYLAHQRLRPGWTERWIAAPQRFLTYATSMPNNFPADKAGQYQEMFAGSPLEQIIGLRDLLMTYPRASALPVNHYWALPLPTDQKSGDNKK